MKQDFTPKSIPIVIGDVWMSRYQKDVIALITKDLGQIGAYTNRIEVVYFGGHHPKQGDKAIVPRHTFRSNFKPQTKR